MPPLLASRIDISYMGVEYCDSHPNDTAGIFGMQIKRVGCCLGEKGWKPNTDWEVVCPCLSHHRVTNALISLETRIWRLDDHGLFKGFTSTRGGTKPHQCLKAHCLEVRTTVANKEEHLSIILNSCFEGKPSLFSVVISLCLLWPFHYIPLQPRL